MIFYFLQGLTLGIPAVATPGPLHAYYLSQTLKRGWRRTLPAALAPIISDGPIILLVLLILTQTPSWFPRLLRVIGGIFLIYLARNAYMTAPDSENMSSSNDDHSDKSLINAVVTNLLNPNPYIFWSTVAGPIFLAGWDESAALGFSFLIGFYVLLVGGFGLTIVAFGTAGGISPRISRYLAKISTAALLLFGLYQIWVGLQG
jgi:threonine/homoserine/homoserine lactone efflux protein